MTVAPGVRDTLDWAGPVDLPLDDDTAVQAACGLMHVHGRKSGRPLPLGVDYATTVAGLLASHGRLAVAIGRERGQEVRAAHTSAAQGALLAVCQYLAAATCAEDRPEPLGTGGPPFVSADGIRFEVETLAAEDWQRFWSRLDADPVAVRRAWRPFQLRFATATCPLPAELAHAARRRAFAELANTGQSSGLSVLAVRDSPVPPVTVPRWDIQPCGRHGPVASYHREGLPLSGIAVVESTSRVQGPLAGHVLRLLGADVLRVEPPGGDPMRGVPPLAGARSARFRALNDGKRAVDLDLKSAAGRAGVLELVADAEVFLHNWRPGRASALGLTAEDLTAVRPGLVAAAASGWGGQLGPNPPLGTDFLVQAHSGLAAAIRPANEPAAPSLMTVTDVLGGLVCAEGVLTALLASLRTGIGSRVESSLLSSALVLRPSSRPMWTEWDRPQETADGYLSIGPAGREKVAAVLGAASFGDRTSDDWVARFADAGVAATAVCTDLRLLAADPRFARALDWDGYAFPRSPWTFS
ncbi:CoA transferase [Amycolatopsis minnesotensis]|uniref:CoA transferase family III n=1 Tax=Amycolatopsis minnesotensis TaxID=337894 RepID=A0ABN2RRK7_9PSEU